MFCLVQRARVRTTRRDTLLQFLPFSSTRAENRERVRFDVSNEISGDASRDRRIATGCKSRFFSQSRLRVQPLLRRILTPFPS